VLAALVATTGTAAAASLSPPGEGARGSRALRAAPRVCFEVMANTERAGLEQQIRTCHERGDLQAAAEIAVRGYGREIWNFLVALHRRDEDGAGESFSLFAEGLWRSLPGFAWQCSFRTWAYAIARRASLRQRRDARRRDARQEALPEGSALSLLVQQIQRDAASSAGVRRRSRLVELRETLPPEDQALLMLRVDRELSWNDLVLVLHEDAAPPEGASLAKEAARLRQRFQTIKEKLYAAAKGKGLVARRSDPDRAKATAKPPRRE
jgi:RNA polymerase sigma-70 factor (ECF subfamily)